MSPALPESSPAAADHTGERSFDIPAQPLDAALEAFARASGVDVLYDKSVTENRLSSAVHGSLTRLDALEQLLSKTGLTARFVRENAVLIMLVPGAHGGPPQDSPPLMRLDALDVQGRPLRIGGDYRQYVANLSADLERRLRQFKEAHPDPFSVVVKLWIGPKGEVTRCEPINAERGNDADQIGTALKGLTAGSPPPDMPQPLRFEVRIH